MKHTSRNFLIGMILLAGVLLSACSGALPINAWPGLTADSSAVYVAEGVGVFALNPNDGSIAWKYPDKSDAARVFYAAPVKGPEGTLLAADYTGGIASLDSKTGTERWLFKDAKGRFIGSPIVSNSTILAANSDHYLYALDLSGNLLWKFAAPEQMWVSPAGNGNAVYVISVDQHLYSVGLKDGKQKWSVKLEGASVGAPVVAKGATIYVGTSIGNFYALDAENGNVTWKTMINKGVWSAPLLKDDTLYVGSGEGIVYALSANNGSIIWKTKAGDAVIGSPTLAGTSLVIAVESGELVSLSLTGEKQWGRSINGKLYTAPVVEGQRIYVAAKGEKLVAAFDFNGTELWKIDPPK
jgi:outer membrane protein assembly factor BamB